MDGTQLILAAISDLRHDVRDLKKSFDGIAIQSGQHKTRIDRLESDYKGVERRMDSFHGKLNLVGIHGETLKSQSFSWKTAIEFLSEAPQLWHVLLTAATLLIWLSIWLKKYLP